MKGKNNTLSVISAIALITIVLVLVAAFKIMPTSVQVYFAGIAGCNLPNADLLEEGSQFKEVKFWEPPLAYIYRWKQLTSAEAFIIDDDLVSNESVFHLLLTASDGTNNKCDTQITDFVKYYYNEGAPIDHVSERGFTPIQEAIITKNINMIRLFKDLGANLDLKVNKNGSPLNGLNAKKIAEYLLEKNPGDDSLKKILEIIS